MGELIGLVAVVMVFGIPMVAIWSKHKEKIAKLQVETTAEHTAEKAAQYAARTSELEERVAVLERIVTDRGYDIATQIEALRDTRETQSTGTGIPLDIKSQEKA